MCIQGMHVCVLHVQKYVAFFFDSLPYSLEPSITEWKPAVLVRLAGQAQGAPRLCLSLAPNAALIQSHVAIPTLLHGWWDSNSGPNTCVTSTLTQ